MIRRREFASGAALVGVSGAGALLSADPTLAGSKMTDLAERQSRLDKALLEQIGCDLALMDRLENLQTGSQGDLAIASHLEQSLVRRQNIWRSSRRRLVECGPRLGVDLMRRACGVASADARWSVA